MDSEATSFIEVFLDKIDENHNSPDTIYNGKFMIHRNFEEILALKLHTSLNRGAVGNYNGRFAARWIGNDWNASELVHIVYGAQS